MPGDKNELRKTILMVTELFNADKQLDIADLLRTLEITFEQIHYDNWNFMHELEHVLNII